MVTVLIIIIMKGSINELVYVFLPDGNNVPLRGTKGGPKEGGLKIGQHEGLNTSRIKSKQTTIKPVVTCDPHSLGPL